MIIINNWDIFILEKYGSNDITKKLSKRILEVVNDNFGKLLLNDNVSITSSIKNIDDIIFNNDLINIKISDRTYGSMNPNKLSIKNNLINNLEINLEVNLSKYDISSKNLSYNKIIETIEHESHHIIERYLTVINNKQYSESWNMGEELHKMNLKYKSKVWLDISYFIYLSLPHEMRAKLQQLNSELENMNINGILNATNYIKETETYKNVIFLSNLNSKYIVSKLKKDVEYNNIISDFSINFLKNNDIN